MNDEDSEAHQRRAVRGVDPGRDDDVVMCLDDGCIEDDGRSARGGRRTGGGRPGA
jgi:hypothetical protein